MNVSQLLIIVFVFSVLKINAQELPEIDDLPSIEVIGKAEKEVIPDEIYITIKLKERNEGRTTISIEEQEKKLKEALKKNQISIKNLELSDANAGYVKVKWSKKDVVLERELVLKVENAEAVGVVFKELDAMKIQNAYISKVSHSKIDDLTNKLRIEAIQKAKIQADYLTSAIGQSILKALSIKEVPYNDYHNYQLGGLVNMQRKSLETDGFVTYKTGVNSMNKLGMVQFKKIKIQAAIYVKFQIK